LRANINDILTIRTGRIDESAGITPLKSGRNSCKNSKIMQDAPRIIPQKPALTVVGAGVILLDNG
jgi:hypothetical protein